MRSILYFLKEALRNAKKNFGTTFGAIVTIFLSLLVIGVFMVGSLIIDSIVQGVESEVSIQIFLNDEAEESDVNSLQNYISTLPDVSAVRYVSKEEAMELFKEMSDPEILEQLDENPLPASLAVELKNPENVEAVVNQITTHSAFLRVIEKPDNPNDSVRYGQQVIDSLFSFANAVRVICVVIIVLLTFVALVFINNTIRLGVLARRKEIAIMRLVGASNNFIRGPFLMEGILQALFGAGLAIVLIWQLASRYIPQISILMPFLSVDYEGMPLWIVYIILLLAGVVIGLLGSVWAMRRYLKI